MKILIEESVLRQAVEALETEANIYIDNDPEDGPPESMADAITALRTALDAAEKVEPDYFGLTEDNTWISCAKRIYDALKPEARMACYPAPTPPTNTDESLVQLANRLAEVIEERDELYKMGLAQSKTINKLEALFRHDELREAAQAVVDRWDSPLWSDLPHTGEYIARLRKALK